MREGFVFLGAHARRAQPPLAPHIRPRTDGQARKNDHAPLARFFPTFGLRAEANARDRRNRSPALGTAGGRYCLIPDPRMMAEAPTVLLIEDNDDNLRIYSTILTYAGYRVLEATDGEAGLASARTAQPDLILMDVSIPKIDGWEATRILKADPATSSIPVIALTAHALASDRERAEQIGFDGYISKPAEPRLVLAEVERRLGKATAGG